MDKKFIPVRIKGIALDHHTQLPIVLLSDREDSFVIPLTIGPFEASAVLVSLEGIIPPRPYTHDLLYNFFTRHNFKLAGMEIYDQQQDKYFARIRYSRGFRKFSMDVRPSDGIALAIRANITISMAQNLASSFGRETILMEKLDPADTDFLYIENEKTLHHFM